ncbi:MAG: hypothetical protein ACXVCP_20065, partial [Bdellovibrio sp.]
ISFNANVSGLPDKHDFNWFSKISSNSCNMAAAAHENIISNYPNDCDVISETLDPFVNSFGTTPESWKPISAAIPALAGTDVCVLDGCNGENKYNLDAFGKLRGASGSWIIGAYEYGATNVLSLKAPANLRVVN